MPKDPNDKIGEDVQKAQDQGYGEISNLDRIKDTDAARARIAAEQGEAVPEPEEKENHLNSNLPIKRLSRRLMPRGLIPTTTRKNALVSQWMPDSTQNRHELR